MATLYICFSVASDITYHLLPSARYTSDMYTCGICSPDSRAKSHASTISRPWNIKSRQWPIAIGGSNIGEDVSCLCVNKVFKTRWNVNRTFLSRHATAFHSHASTNRATWPLPAHNSKCETTETGKAPHNHVAIRPGCG